MWARDSSSRSSRVSPGNFRGKHRSSNMACQASFIHSNLRPNVLRPRDTGQVAFRRTISGVVGARLHDIAIHARRALVSAIDFWAATTAVPPWFVGTEALLLAFGMRDHKWEFLMRLARERGQRGDLRHQVCNMPPRWHSSGFQDRTSRDLICDPMRRVVVQPRLLSSGLYMGSR